MRGSELIQASLISIIKLIIFVDNNLLAVKIEYLHNLFSVNCVQYKSHKISRIIVVRKKK